jgi:hypothetical protein
MKFLLTMILSVCQLFYITTEIIPSSRIFQKDGKKEAETVLRAFKPKLAIMVYHDFREFWTFTQYVNSLGLGYRFYLRHLTIHT